MQAILPLQVEKRMLKKADGSVVVATKRGNNHIEDGFVVAHKSDHSFLRPLREVKTYLTPKCGKMFNLMTRVRGIE